MSGRIPQFDPLPATNTHSKDDSPSSKGRRRIGSKIPFFRRISLMIHSYTLPVCFAFSLLVSVLVCAALTIAFDDFGMGVVGFALTLAAFSFLMINTLLFDRIPRNQASYIDSELTAALLSQENIPLIVTDEGGRFILGNQAFTLLNLPLQSIQSLYPAAMTDSEIDQWLNTINSATDGHSSAGLEILAKSIHVKLPKRDDLYRLSARSMGHYLVWSLVPLAQSLSDSSLKQRLANWPIDFITKQNFGLIIIGMGDDVVYMNRQVKQWLDMSDDQPYPAKLPISKDLKRLTLPDQSYIPIDCQRQALPGYGFLPSPGHYYIISRDEPVSQIDGPGVISGVISGAASGTTPASKADILLSNAPLAAICTDRKGLIQAGNDLFMALFGLDGQTINQNEQGKITGKLIQSFVHKNSVEDMQSLIKAASKGRIQSESCPVILSNDNPGQVFISPLTVDGGDVQQMVLFFFDESEHRNLELQFVQAQKMQAVGQLAGGVAHDFNNLLTAIIGFCDLLLMRHVPGDQSFSDINQIKQNANRAANLVRQLLAFSRQQTLRPKVLRMADVLSDVSNLIRRLIGENIKFSINLGRNLPDVRADQGQLEQVMINLAVNARDAMAAGGELTISTRFVASGSAELPDQSISDPRDFIAVTVTDTGSGISPEIKAKIFDPFFTTKKVGEGTGLGLSTVYGIVKQTGGNIVVDSKMGQGTAFHVYLPCFRPVEDSDDLTDIAITKIDAMAHSDSDSANKDLTGKGCVLLVEDETPVRMFAARALKNKGYDVLEAECGETGLALLQSQEKQIDLLVTDVIMPNMDGPTLFKEARLLYPQMPVIFISGYAEDVFRQDLADDSFDFLAKPFSLNDLAAKVKAVLSNK